MFHQFKQLRLRFSSRAVWQLRRVFSFKINFMYDISIRTHARLIGKRFFNGLLFVFCDACRSPGLLAELLNTTIGPFWRIMKDLYHFIAFGWPAKQAMSQRIVAFFSRLWMINTEVRSVLIILLSHGRSNQMYKTKHAKQTQMNWLIINRWNSMKPETKLLETNLLIFHSFS